MTAANIEFFVPAVPGEKKDPTPEIEKEEENQGGAAAPSAAGTTPNPAKKKGGGKKKKAEIFAFAKNLKKLVFSCRTISGETFVFFPGDSEEWVVKNIENIEFKNRIIRNYEAVFGDLIGPTTVQRVIDHILAHTDETETAVFPRIAGGDGEYVYWLRPGFVVRYLKDEFSFFNAFSVRRDPKFWAFLPDQAKPQETPDRNPDMTPEEAFNCLRDFFRVDDETYLLIIGAIIHAFLADKPQPIVVLTGGHGAAKTTTARVIKEIVDPAFEGAVFMPPKINDIIPILEKNYCVIFDNVSNLQSWQSDLLCMVATRGTVSFRKLYTNKELAVTPLRNFVILTGIGEIVSKNDLMDRSLFVRLERIPPEERKTEEEFWGEFRLRKKEIITAIFFLVSKVLAERENIELDTFPRMADFVKTGCALTKVVHDAERLFLYVYNKNKNESTADAINNDIVANIVFELAINGGFEGTAMELLQKIKQKTPLETHRFLPGTPKALRQKLEEIKPTLFDLGINIFFKRTATARLVVIEEKRKEEEQLKLLQEEFPEEWNSGKE